MLSLSGTPIQLKNLKVTARHRLAGDDMSGQSAATDQAETGDKAKVLAVTGTLNYAEHNALSQLFALSSAKDKGARKIYRIQNRTAKTVKIREVKFQGTITAQEDAQKRQWMISFELVEHHSVPERQEQREDDKKAQQQKVDGATTPVENGEATAQADVPPDTDVELTGFMGLLKKLDEALA
ncbi:adenine glycosylase [Salinivibrio sp. SS3]|uniref:Adenine glycosylase n=1 Tax=Salinivibrio phage SMHB1 TaxID=1897436 RepID=A0A1D9C9T7_9CAUD|nr:adenine glycosylase [Salinivibrio sp. BNH]YP_009786989.1 adenine glycosylase [Salinivibrio phage SMHB1]AOY11852.1 hypothetical protein [Salinivibrio phage SMHB1]ODP98267.1 adenine glycosylase [Salinivibrio sp. BNH]